MELTVVLVSGIMVQCVFFFLRGLWDSLYICLCILSGFSLGETSGLYPGHPRWLCQAFSFLLSSSNPCPQPRAPPAPPDILCFMCLVEVVLGEGDGNPLQCSCLENPVDRGAWQATVHRVTGVGHNLATKLQKLKQPA